MGCCPDKQTVPKGFEPAPCGHLDLSRPWEYMCSDCHKCYACEHEYTKRYDRMYWICPDGRRKRVSMDIYEKIHQVWPPGVPK